MGIDKLGSFSVHCQPYQRGFGHEILFQRNLPSMAGLLHSKETAQILFPKAVGCLTDLLGEAGWH